MGSSRPTAPACSSGSSSAGRDRSEATAGIGLGLPITLLIVQAHDGRIDVRSRPGHGSTFSIVVPAAGPKEVPGNEDPRDRRRARCRRSVRLGFTLQWREIDVVGAVNGEAALDSIERERPDIVLLDVGLPDIDGFEVLRQIRAFSDVPVVMLTARDDSMDKVKGLELGADDYVTKPFNHLELMARVKAVLRRLDMPAPASRAPSFRSGDLEVDFARGRGAPAR